MILFKEVDRSFFSLYDRVTMNVDVHSEYRVERIQNGLGGLLLKEIPVKPYIKDLGQYEHATELENELDMGVSGAKHDGYSQMIIECQNNNVPACRFYQKQGAVLSKIDMYAYYFDPKIKDEIQFVWYLDI